MRWQIGVGTFVAASLATTLGVSAGSTVRAPLACTHGSSDQHFTANVTVPPEAAEGSTYTVRIDSTPSGTIQHAGLRFIHDMSTDYLLPAGATYVPGSARFVPHTGTANALPGARVWHDGGVLHVVLPAFIENGSGYTPPAVELQLRVAAPAGTRLPVRLSQVRVTANVFLLGDLRSDCDPTPRPYVIGTTTVTKAPSP